MHKRIIIIVIVCLVIIGGIGVMYYVNQVTPVEPDVNTNQAVNDVKDVFGYTDEFGNVLVEYESGMGDVCPIDVTFVGSKDSNAVDCACPEGYEKISTRIGGESCYDGAECPIFSVRCE